MGLGKYICGALPSWIQISSVKVNIMKALYCGAKVLDPLTEAMIYTIGAIFFDNMDIYCWVESLKTEDGLFEQLQTEIIL